MNKILQMFICIERFGNCANMLSLREIVALLACVFYCNLLFAFDLVNGGRNGSTGFMCVSVCNRLCVCVCVCVSVCVLVMVGF